MCDTDEPEDVQLDTLLDDVLSPEPEGPTPDLVNAKPEALIDPYTTRVLERLADTFDCGDLCHLIPQCDAASFIERLLDRREAEVQLVQSVDEEVQAENPCLLCGEEIGTNPTCEECQSEADVARRHPPEEARGVSDLIGDIRDLLEVEDVDQIPGSLRVLLGEYEEPEEPEDEEFVFGPPKPKPSSTEPFDRVYALLNQLFPTLEFPYENLSAMTIPMNPVQREVVFALMVAYPELLPRENELTVWGLLNAVVDILCGRRLDLIVEKKSQLIHRVQWTAGLRGIAEEAQSGPSKEQSSGAKEETQTERLHGSS